MTKLPSDHFDEFGQPQRRQTINPLLGLAFVACLCLIGGCRQWYVRWANGASTHASPPSSGGGRLRLVNQTALPDATQLSLQTVDSGGYVQFVVDQICFAELPSVIGNQNDSWVSVSMMSDTTTNSTLFTDFSNHLGANAASPLRPSIQITPPQRLITNAGGCVPSVGYRTPLLPLENSAISRSPRMLFTATVLLSEKRERYVDAGATLSAQIGTISDTFGLNLSSYIGTFNTILSQTNQLLSLLTPDQIILWADGSIPVLAVPNHTDQLQIPAETQRFVHLFADQQTVNGGNLMGCVRSQSQVVSAVSNQQIEFDPQSQQAMYTPGQSPCGGRSDYGQPYIVWHVRYVPSAEIEDQYWTEVTSFANHVRLGDSAFGYRAALDALSARSAPLRDTNRHLLSNSQTQLFETLERVLGTSALVMVPSGGVRGDACVVTQELSRLIDQHLERRWQASTGVEGSLRDLRDAVRSRCPTEAARQSAVTFSEGMFNSFACQWLSIGVGASNRLCNGGPCDIRAVMQQYGRQIHEFSQSELDAICSVVNEHLAQLTHSSTLTLACDDQSPWFARYNNTPFCVPGRGGFCNAGVLGNTAAEVSLFQDVIQARSQTQQDSTIQALLNGLAGAGNPAVFAAAETQWNRALALCGPGGNPCQFIEAMGLHDNARWENARRKLFLSWLDYFASGHAGNFAPGCASGAMYWNLGSTPSWAMSQNGCSGRGPICFPFEPRGDVRPVSESFAVYLLPDSQ